MSDKAAVTGASSKKQCVLCNQPGTKTCGGCGEVSYCSRDHQRDDWKEHKKVCKQKHKQQEAKPAAAVAAKGQPAAPAKPIAATAINSKGEYQEPNQVTWEDQQRINQFGRLSTKSLQLEAEIAQNKRAQEQLEDAREEIDSLFDDDACMVKVGDCFAPVENDDAEEYVNKRIQEQKQLINNLKTQPEPITQEMAQLKSVLYHKFGDSISLEK